METEQLFKTNPHCFLLHFYSPGAASTKFSPFQNDEICFNYPASQKGIVTGNDCVKKFS